LELLVISSPAEGRSLGLDKFGLILITLVLLLVLALLLPHVPGINIMAEDSDRTPRFPLLGNGNYGEWSIRMEAELIRKGLWDQVYVEVDITGKTEDEVKAELQKLMTKRKKMAEARAEIILRIERDQLAHARDRDPKIIWETLARLHRARGLGTRMALRRKLLTATKGAAESMSAWISRVKGMALDLEDIGVNVDDEDRILALTTGLDKSYDSFVISLDSTATADLTFDHVVNRLLNEDIRRGSVADEEPRRADAALLSSSQGHGQRNVSCYRCGKEGHIRAFCTATPIRGKGTEKGADRAAMAVENFAF
jgi:hypothetical protein